MWLFWQAACDPSRCVVEGEGKEQIEAGRLSGVVVHLFDRYGNRMSHADSPPIKRLGVTIQLLVAHGAPGTTANPNPTPNLISTQTIPL